METGLRGEIGGLRGDMSTLDSSLRNEIGGLRGDVNTLDSNLRGEIGGLHGELNTLDSSLRGELKATESGLRDEMQAGFKELTSRVLNIGDRLSKVEGIIEGVFWGARNQHADKPGEGAA